MSTNNWGKLVRVVGGSDSELIPEVILLFDQKNFFGRVPNADTSKFSHIQQFVIPLPYLSSTHFCIETISSNDGMETSFMITDYSRNGTFFRHKQDTQNPDKRKVESMGSSKTAVICDGDEIILMFRNEITVIYTFTENAQLKAGSKNLERGSSDEIVVVDEPRPLVKVSGPPVSSSRKRPKEEEEKNPEEGKAAAAVKGGSGDRLLKQQVASLQLENKGQERRLAAAVAASTTLTMDLNARERELRTLQSTLTMKDLELVSVTDSLRASEANAAATEARVRVLDDSSEVSNSID
jgi:FHA domain